MQGKQNLSILCCLAGGLSLGRRSSCVAHGLWPFYLPGYDMVGLCLHCCCYTHPSVVQSPSMDQIIPFLIPGQGKAGMERLCVQDRECFQGLHRADSPCKQDDSTS